jgi:hypothetical protein
MLNCEQVTRLAGDYHERRLGWRSHLAVLAHIAMCRGCRVFLEQFRLVLRGLQALPAPLAAAVDEPLLERFRLELGGPGR